MDDITSLEALGYSPRWQALFEPFAAEGLVPARVVRSDRGGALLATPQGIVRGQPSAGLSKVARRSAAMPATGDWVAALADDGLDVALIEAVLERTSAITRGDPGKTSDIQVLAANMDTVFVVHPLAEPPNLRRIERELSLAWDSGAVPVVVLTKSDLSADAEAARRATESVAPGVDVLVTNALSGESAELLLAYITGHRTAVLVGPSGAGKSTLINWLLGEQRQATRDVRVGDGRGRHTTVARELIPMPRGGVLIDTPGLRALGLTGSEDGIASVFPDIELLAESCRFRDCTHDHEPGCAVRAAVESGAIPTERLASYHKLLAEAQAVAAKADGHLRAERDRRSKTDQQGRQGVLQADRRRLRRRGTAEPAASPVIAAAGPDRTRPGAVRGRSARRAGRTRWRRARADRDAYPPAYLYSLTSSQKPHAQTARKTSRKRGSATARVSANATSALAISQTTCACCGVGFDSRRRPPGGRRADAMAVPCLPPRPSLRTPRTTARTTSSRSTCVGVTKPAMPPSSRLDSSERKRRRCRAG